MVYEIIESGIDTASIRSVASFLWITSQRYTRLGSDLLIELVPKQDWCMHEENEIYNTKMYPHLISRGPCSFHHFVFANSAYTASSVGPTNLMAWEITSISSA